MNSKLKSFITNLTVLRLTGSILFAELKTTALLAPISPNTNDLLDLSANVWTGMSPVWVVQASCSNWTSFDAASKGSIGNSYKLDVESVISMYQNIYECRGASCDSRRSLLYCVTGD